LIWQTSLANFAMKELGFWGMMQVIPANYLFLYSKIIVLLHWNRLGDYPISLAAITTTPSIKIIITTSIYFKGTITADFLNNAFLNTICTTYLN
jgi:hypothetical protein